MPRLAAPFTFSLNKYVRIYLHILIRFRDCRGEKAFTKGV